MILSLLNKDKIYVILTHNKLIKIKNGILTEKNSSNNSTINEIRGVRLTKNEFLNYENNIIYKDELDEVLRPFCNYNKK